MRKRHSLLKDTERGCSQEEQAGFPQSRQAVGTPTWLADEASARGSRRGALAAEGGKASGPRERASIFNQLTLRMRERLVAKVSSRADIWVS